MGMLTLLLLISTAYPATVEENRQVIRKASELLLKDDETLARFFFVRRREKREFDSDGKLKSKEITTTRREAYEDLVITRLIARDDKPLSADEIAKQNESIKANVAAYRARIAKQGPAKPAPKQEDDGDALIREIADALDFKLIGPETHQGRPANVYEFSPRPGYTPKTMKSRIFEKIRGKAVLDQATSQIMLVEAEAFDNISIAFGFVGKIAKGTRFHMRRKEAAPGLWVAEGQRMAMEARIMLVKSMRQEMDTTFSEFQLRPPTPVSAAKR